VDQLLCRSLPTQQPAHGLRRNTGLLPTGDLIPHQPQCVDLIGQIPAVLTGSTAQGGDAIPEFPGSKCRHRHAKDQGDILDRNTPRIPDRDITTGRHLHASLSVVPSDSSAIPHPGGLPTPTIGSYHPALPWGQAVIRANPTPLVVDPDEVDTPGGTERELTEGVTMGIPRRVMAPPDQDEHGGVFQNPEESVLAQHADLW